MDIRRTTGWEDGLAKLAQRLVRGLMNGKQVLWLVSGGSNIAASVEIMQSISHKLSKKLSIMLIDERFGPAGHPDSNWEQLIQAGFDAKNAHTIPVLVGNEPLPATVTRYSQQTKKALDSADIVIAQLGIGADGHIAGILPGSAAAAEKTELVVGYNGVDYTRVTMTFPAMRHIDIAYAFAFGNTKKATLKELAQSDKSLKQQPAQILKEVRKAYIYNDQIGDTR